MTARSPAKSSWACLKTAADARPSTRLTHSTSAPLTAQPTNVHARPCTDAQWDGVIALLNAVYAGEGYVPREHATRSYTRERLSAGGLVLVAHDASELLGVVVLAYPDGELSQLAGPGEAEFRMLAVAPSGRGRGIGTMLVSACLDHASGEPFNANRLVLWTQPSMKAAQRLYERLGFERAPERDNVLPPLSEGSPPIEQLVYTRTITSG